MMKSNKVRHLCFEYTLWNPPPFNSRCLKMLHKHPRLIVTRPTHSRCCTPLVFFTQTRWRTSDRSIALRYKVLFHSLIVRLSPCWNSNNIFHDISENIADVFSCTINTRHYNNRTLHTRCLKDTCNERFYWIQYIVQHKDRSLRWEEAWMKYNANHFTFQLDRTVFL